MHSGFGETSGLFRISDDSKNTRMTKKLPEFEKKHPTAKFSDSCRLFAVFVTFSTDSGAENVGKFQKGKNSMSKRVFEERKSSNWNKKL